MVFFCSDLLFLKIIVIVLGKDSRIVLEALVNESQPIDTSQRSRIRDRSEWKSYDQEHISIWFIIYFIQPWAGYIFTSDLSSK
ncbi:hypothetical protein L1987_65097 [Smallanthus sonchifolius]|uniref:Uncharacterized protein n=1 Tax=Smallanthus sonchifolius TaxID=185202 RepID=A0ACB9BTI3_9ASTR|nr:hypothetical protein L1987_65097 [Smallanthus sonchifolius]